MPLSSVDFVVASPGSGGANLVGETYTDSGDGQQKFIPFSGIVIGTQNGTYELVGPAVSLPVSIPDGVAINDDGGSITIDGAVEATQSGDWLVDLCDGSGNAISSAVATPASDVRGLVVRTVGPNDQGEPSSVDNAWPVKISDGTDTATLTTIDDNVGIDVNVIGGVGGSSQTDKALFNPGTDVLTMAGGTYRSSRDNVGDGRGGAFAMTAVRALYTCLETQTGDPIADDTLNSLRVMVVDGTGSQITSFGGGVEYNEGSTDSSITGKAILWEDSSDTLRVPSATYPLPVTVIASTAGGTSMVDDAAFTFGTTSFTPSGGVYNSSRDSVDSGDGGAFAMSAKRAMYVTPETPDGDSMVNETINCLKVAILDTAGSHIETFGGGAQYDEDTAHAGGDTGTMVLAVRRDANTSLVDATGDYAPLQVDATGSLKVSIISGAGSGGTAMTDDAAFTPEVTNITPAGGTYRATRDSIDDGDGGAIAITAKRASLVSPETINGDPVTNDTLNSVVTSSAFPTSVSALVSGTGTSSSLDTSELGAVAVTLHGTAATITAVFQASCDGGTTWVNLLGRRTTTGIFETGPVGLSLSGTVASWQVSVAGYNRFRINFTAVTYTSLTYVIQGISETFPGEGLDGTRLDDAAFTFGSDYLTAIGGVYNSSRDSLDSGDAGVIALNQKRGVYTTLESSAGVAVVVGTADPAAGDNSLSVRLTPPTSNSVAYPMKVTDGTNTATIRDLSSNDALNVAIVDGSGAHLTQILNAEFAQGATHGSSDKGIMAMATRHDANTSLVASDGQVAPLQLDSSGNLKVNVVAGSGGGSSGLTDDSAFTVASSTVTPVGGYYASSRDSVDNGDTGAFAMTVKRAQYVALETPLGDSLVDDTNDAVRVQSFEVITDNGAFTDGTSKVFMGGFVFDETAGTTLTENDAVAARVDSKRAQVLVIEDATTRGQRASVSSAGNLGVQESSSLVDDAAFTPGTSRVLAVAGTYRSSRDSLDNNDAGAIALNQKRGVYISPETVTGDSLSDDSTDAIRSVSQSIVALAATTITGTGTTSFTTGAISNSSYQQAGYMIAVKANSGTITSIAFSIDQQDNESYVATGIRHLGLGYTKTSITLKSLTTVPVLLWVPALVAGAPRINVSAITLGSAGNATFTIAALGSVPSVLPVSQSVSRLISGASTNLTTAKSSAGVVTGYSVFNNSSSFRYLKFYDSTGATVGTTTPVATFMIPKEGGLNLSNLEIPFETGIQFAITDGIEDSDTTAINANEVSVNVFYR